MNAKLKLGKYSLMVLTGFLLTLLAGDAFGQTNAFTYQGRLNDGTNPANGKYDLTFQLFDAATNGNQVNTTITNANLGVSNGLFVVMLNFGTNVFLGADRWLQIGVRTNGSATGFVSLSPRQMLTPAPYATFAQTAASLNNGFGNLPSGGQSAIGGGAWNYASGSYATIAGGNSNTNTGYSSTIGGGINNTATGAGYATISGGEGNTAYASDAVIGGGKANRVGQAFSTVGGGILNGAEDFFSFIGGGSNNVVSWGGRFSVIAGGTLNNTAGSYSSIGGGVNNMAGGQFATVPGGTSNSAQGNFSFAAGNRAKAGNTGSFVWADSQSSDFSSTTANQFNVRAGGGVRFVTGGAGMTVDGVSVLVGSGGGGIAWQNVTGTSQQAQPNNGYVVNNTAQLVTITLPASPNIGDIVRVSGAGAGGWQIAQNAGQSILTLNAGGRAGLIWSQTTAPDAQFPTTSWRQVASSADGSHLFAVQDSYPELGPGYGGIWASSNYGATWVQTSAPLTNWISVATSADGKYVVAGILGGGIWRSANYGTTWTQISITSGYWVSIAASADGSKFFATREYGGIYSSTNYGSTWTQTTAPTDAWYDIASSADGKRLIAVIGTGGIWASTNSGATWSQTSAASTHAGSYWQSVASSADGSRLVAVMYYGGIYTSTDYGTTWAQMSTPGTSTNWNSVASSADGSKLVATASIDGIYASTNFGVTWMKTTAPYAIWASVASSVDGSRLAASAGGIYTSVASTTLGLVGGLSGAQGTAIELQYVGNGQFLPLNYAGTINSY